MRLSQTRPNVDLAPYCGEPGWSSLQRSLADADEATALRLIELDVRRRLEAGQFPNVQEYLPLFEVPPENLDELISDINTSHPTVNPEVESASLGSPDLATTRYLQTPRDKASQEGPAPEEVPEQIDHFDVVDMLGEGAFGTVLLAIDTKLNRKVAIKMPLRKLLEQPGAVEHFLDETRAVARLSHPGIVPIYNCGVLPDGRAYAVLEYLPGGTLSERLRQKPLQIMEAVDLLIQLADAMHYAHQRGIYHLDLKPSNILLDENGQPKISDFGLSLNAEMQLSQKSYVGGTPSYMSPEQTRGETRRLDGRSDIWALGVMMYLLLAGRLPFRASDVDELFDAIRTHDPRPMRQINDQIPQSLDQCVQRCLEKHPRDRYETAGDLAAELREWKLNASGFVRVDQALAANRVGNQPEPVDSAQKDGSTARAGSTQELEPSPLPAAAPRTNWTAPILIMSLLVVAGVVWKSELLSKSVQQPAPLLQPSPAQPTPAQPVPVEQRDTNLSNFLLPKEVETTVNVPAGFAGPLESILTPDQWHPLLDRPPYKLHWPLIDRDSSYEYKLKERELWLTVSGLGMVELGQTYSQNYRIRANFSQQSSDGGVGLFWGYQPIDGEVGARYLKLELVSIPVKSQIEYALKFSQVSCKESGFPTEMLTIQMEKILNARNPVEGFSIEIEIKDGKLANVWWCGQLCQKLAVPNEFIPVTVIPQTGAFGVFNERTSSIVRRTSFKYSKAPKETPSTEPAN